MGKALRALVLTLFIGGLSANGLAAPAKSLCPTPQGLPGSDRVRINSADQHTLAAKLRGIGPSKAKAIVQYRKVNGPFRQVEELLEVKGIGPAILKKNCRKLAL